MSGYDQFFKEAQKARGKGKTIRRPTAPSKKTAKAETPEDRIRAELALRMQNKKRALKSKRAKFPVGAAITAVAVFAIGLVGYMRSDLIEDAMDNVFGHVEIGFFGSAEASAPKDDQKNQKKHAEAKPAASKEAAPAKPINTPVVRFVENPVLKNNPPSNRVHIGVMLFKTPAIEELTWVCALKNKNAGIPLPVNPTRKKVPNRLHAISFL